MPRYEYKCDTCGHEFEIQAKMDDPPPKCPREEVVRDSGGSPLYEVGHGDRPMTTRCGGPTHKLISRSTFMLKGGGWAADGYSSGGK